MNGRDLCWDNTHEQAYLMPVSPKAILLDALPAARLRELADDLEVNGSRQSKADLIEAFTRYRRLSAERICELLSVDELKACCDHAGLTASARTKQQLITALLAGAAKPARVTPDRPRMDAPDESPSRANDPVQPVPTRNTTMTGSQQRAALQRQIWAIANEVRGAVDGWDFKQYVLGALFYRFISENFASYIEADDDSVDYAAMSDTVITDDIKDDAIKTKGYFIYPSQLFVNIVASAADNEKLNTDLAAIFKAIEGSANGYDSEESIKGLFADFDTTSNRLGNTVVEKNTRLAAVLKGVAGLDFGDFHGSQIDLFGDAYEFLISNYAANAGKSGGEFFTPQNVSRLIAKLALHKQNSVNKIYDPACGSGSLLLQAKKQFDNHQIEDGFFGQEINHTTYNLARMNMFLHNINYDKFHIKLGNTLLDPHFGDDKPFDAIVSNPPYSLNWKGDEDPTLINDERFAPAGVLAPKSKADFAFVLHALHYLSGKGRAAIVCFPGIFYRGGAEQKIRKYLVDNNYVEAVIALAPNLFYGTTIAVTILVLSKHKPDTAIRFIDASGLCKKETNNNVLVDDDDPGHPGHIQQIMRLFDDTEKVDHLAESVPFERVATNDYNLSVSSYVAAKDNREVVNIAKLNADLKITVTKIDQLRKDINTIVKEIDGSGAPS